ncbi:lysozyme inhibitor LprI family protein [Aurantiacibacter suaedae]|uniref:lysozyme inhibitor LprI family protein n=1 Tax=Aurantiacibacter suaedae TaxID=2545755 RepID=UPI001F4F7C10|nr:lysozyme inhibitor LprI family protein [Aurantiacibacter suaedae]
MIGLLLLLAAGTAAAEPADICAEPITQADMNQCAARNYAEADEALNVQWSRTAEAMRERDSQLDRKYDDRPGYFETLLAAQRAWITYRDEHCTSDGYLYRGGSMEPLIVSTCKTELTKQRTSQLADLMSAE